MKWERKTLGDITNIFSGYAFKSSSMSKNEGIPLIKIKNILSNSVTEECDTYLIPDKIDPNMDKFILQQGDFLVAMTGQGSVGRIGRMKKVIRKFYVNQRVAIVRTNLDIANPSFVYYQIATKQNEKVLFDKANGAGQPNISAKQIGELPVALPTIDIQDKIASILSAYDDLIENNQKQIKLLEEAAQRLYKEWFVDLRFPNYENTPVVDGVPEGWRIGRLDELGEFKRGKTITKDSVISGNVPVVAGGLEPAYFHNTANTVAPVITVSGSGANAGFTRMYHVNVWASDCSFVDSNTTENIYMIYCYLKANKADLDRLQKGAAQPHVYAKDINAMTIMIANNVLLLRFNETVSPIFTKIGNLFQQIEKLKEARDRLLPKLMSGELEV